MSRMGRVWVPFRRPGVPQWRQGKHFGAHVCRRTMTRAASMPVSFLGRCGSTQGGTGWILWQDQTARGVETCRVEREVSILFSCFSSLCLCASVVAFSCLYFCCRGGRNFSHWS